MTSVTDAGSVWMLTSCTSGTVTGSLVDALLSVAVLQFFLSSGYLILTRQGCKMMLGVCVSVCWGVGAGLGGG